MCVVEGNTESFEPCFIENEEERWCVLMAKLLV